MYWGFVEEYLLQGRIPASGPLIDIGCGVGNMTANLAAVAPDRELLGFDLNPRIIKAGARYCGAPNLHLICADAFASENKGRYSAAFALEILEHLPAHRHHEFVELALRTLAPGGLLFLTTPNGLDERDEPFGHIGLLNRKRAAEFVDRFAHNIVDLSYYDNTHLTDERTSTFHIRGAFADFDKDDQNRSHFRFVLAA
jgi:2-polyprenyl-3-methyl-5-hydroxy-6-metoxy-1,4-benzoquinol methylase